MFTYCPRCENGKLDSSGNCGNCGYTLRLSCSCCGFKNIPLAKFCGNCGQGLSLKTRLIRSINRNISLIAQLKLRKFATGIAFGTLLAFFAFGSMGMQARTSNQNCSLKSLVNTNFSFNEQRLAGPINELLEFRNARDPHAQATLNDLKKFSEILLSNLGDAIQTGKDQKLGDRDATTYINRLRNFSKQGVISRGCVAMLLFTFANDFLDISYKDFTDENQFIDIPKFHFLSIPTAALTSLGINLQRNADKFGVNEAISVEELFQAGIDFTYATEVRIKQKVFKTLDPK